jgi:hypothetical protein
LCLEASDSAPQNADGGLQGLRSEDDAQRGGLLIRTIASVGSWITGSGRSPASTAPGPWNIAARIAGRLLDLGYLQWLPFQATTRRAARGGPLVRGTGRPPLPRTPGHSGPPPGSFPRPQMQAGPGAKRSFPSGPGVLLRRATRLTARDARDRPRQAGPVSAGAPGILMRLPRNAAPRH